MFTTEAPAIDSGRSLEHLADVFRVLSDKTRLNILLALRGGEQNVSTLCERLNLPQPTVSHHLGLLRMSQLVENRRAGKQIFYGLSERISPTPADGAMTLTAKDFLVTLAAGPGSGVVGTA